MAVFVFAVHIDIGARCFLIAATEPYLAAKKMDLAAASSLRLGTPALAQKIRQLSIGLAAGKVERSAPFLVLRCEIGLGLYQLVGCLELIVLGRVVQRCLLLLLRRLMSAPLASAKVTTAVCPFRIAACRIE